MGRSENQNLPHPYRRAEYATLVMVCLLAAFFAWNAIHAFSHLDPRFDQAWNPLAAKRLATATHFLPIRRPSDTFRTALEADPQAWLSTPAKLYAVTTIVLFDSTSIVTNWLGMLLLGPAYRTTLLTSIAASCLTSVLVFLWSRWLFAYLSPVRRALTAGIGSVLILVCAYRHYFSPWGAHNFAVFFLTAAAMLTAAILKRWQERELIGRGAVLGVALLHLLAFYSYSTNVLLLGIATPVAILLMRSQPWKARLLWAAAYLAFVAGTTGTILIREYPSPTGFDSPNPHPLQADFHGALSWFAAGAGYYSLPGFLLALTGLTLLSARLKASFPAVLLATHFALWTFMRTFTWNATPTGLRTFNYILPLFALGGAACLGFCLSTHRRPWRIPMLIATGALLCVHLGLQGSLLASQQRFLQRVPLFYDTYLKKQGMMAAWAATIDRTLPPGATLLASDSEVSTYFELLTTRRDLFTHAPPTMSALLTHAQSGDLPYYLQYRRPVTIHCDALYTLEDVTAAGWAAKVATLPEFGCGSFQGVTLLGQYLMPRDGGLARVVNFYAIHTSK